MAQQQHQAMPSATRTLPSVKIRSARSASAPRAPSAAPAAAAAAAVAAAAAGASLAGGLARLFTPRALAGCGALASSGLYHFFLRGGLCAALASAFQALALLLLTFVSCAFWACLYYTPFMAFPGIVALLCLLVMLLLSYGPVVASALCGVHGVEFGRCFRAGMLAFVGALSVAAVGVFVAYEERRYLVLTSPPTLIVATSVCLVAGFACLWAAAALHLCTVCAARGWCCAPPYSLQGEEEEGEGEEDGVAWEVQEDAGREAARGAAAEGERVEVEVR